MPNPLHYQPPNKAKPHPSPKKPGLFSARGPIGKSFQRKGFFGKAVHKGGIGDQAVKLAGKGIKWANKELNPLKGAGDTLKTATIIAVVGAVVVGGYILVQNTRPRA